MQTVKRLSLALAATAYLFACSGPTEPDHQSFIYPLAVGNQWVYDYTEISVYSDSTPTDTIQYTLTATVVKADTILPGIVAYLIQESGTVPGGGALSGYRSYVNMPGGMYAYYRSEPGPGMALPKSDGDPTRSSPDSRIISGSAPPLPFPLLGDGNSGADYYHPAPLILPYPQEAGFRWLVGDTLRLIEGSYWLDKLITGWETVTTSAGTFDGIVINWIYNWPFETTEESCIMSPVGMVLRTANYLDIPVTSYAFPYGTGETRDLYTKYELVSYILNSQ